MHVVLPFYPKFFIRSRLHFMISILLVKTSVVPTVPSCSWRFLHGSSYTLRLRSPSSRCASRHRVLRSSFFSPRPASPRTQRIHHLVVLRAHAVFLRSAFLILQTTFVFFSPLSSNTPRLLRLFRRSYYIPPLVPDSRNFQVNSAPALSFLA